MVSQVDRAIFPRRSSEFEELSSKIEASLYAQGVTAITQHVLEVTSSAFQHLSTAPGEAGQRAECLQSRRAPLYIRRNKSAWRGPHLCTLG
jgi:hypothetical protein